MARHHSTLNKMIRRLGVALAITSSIAVAEIVGGLLSNSLALLGDAGHMVTDSLAITLSIIAFRLSRRPPTAERTYGLLRVEILAALVNGAVLLLVAAVLIYEGISRLRAPPEVNIAIMLPVAAAGLAANLAGASLLRGHAAGSLNVRGAFYHMLGDAASSFAVITGGALIYLTGEHLFDPIASFAVAALIIRGSWRLLSDSVNILAEAVPPHVDTRGLVDELMSFPEIDDVHDLHIWTITSGVYSASGHIVVRDQMIGGTSGIIAKVNRLLDEKYGITHTTWQLECESCGEAIICTIDRRP